MALNPKIAAALLKLQHHFPFQHYFGCGFAAHENVANTALELLPAGAKVLDIGCGPADKTAVLAYLGYACTGYDDFGDPWHKLPENSKKITDFFAKAGIKKVVADHAKPMPFKPETFDFIMLNDIIEHFNMSPRSVLEEAIGALKTGGYLYISVPNAVNLRKRLAVLFGKTNLPPYTQFYWSEGLWRGHIREYVQDDLVQLNAYLALDIIQLNSAHHMLNVLPTWAQPLFKLACKLVPSFADSWVYVAQKPENWSEKLAQIKAQHAPATNEFLR